jgi:hypothetical protein
MGLGGRIQTLGATSMKPYRITVISAGSRTQFTGIFKSAIDATLAGMDQLNESDPHGRVEVKPI